MEFPPKDVAAGISACGKTHRNDGRSSKSVRPSLFLECCNESVKLLELSPRPCKKMIVCVWVAVGATMTVDGFIPRSLVYIRSYKYKYCRETTKVHRSLART